MKYIFFVFVCAGLAGCAATYKDFKGAGAGEVTAIGRVELIFNGENRGEKCSVCFNGVNGPCQKLSPEGLVFIALPPGLSSLRRVQCQDSSPHHYNIEGALFEAKEGVNFFGHVNVSWKTKGGFKASTLFGLVGAIADESSNDGAIEMRVSDRGWEEVVKVFRRQTGSREKVRKTLAREGK